MRWLTNIEAAKLLKKYWKNLIISSREISPFKIFFSQFKDPLSLILIWACVFSYIFWEELEAIVIFIVILINSFIWFFQEYKAEKWVEALRKMVSYTVKVIRNWKYVKIKTENLVPWDLIELYEWDKVPADGKIIESNEFKLNESALTWESAFILKETWDVFMWTLVVKWKALIEVQKTWMNTKFWVIAHLTTVTKEQKSPIQKEIEKIWKTVWVFVLVITLLIFFYSLYKNWLQSDKLLDSFLYSISIAVAAVPEGLNTTMLIVMTIAATHLASKKALIKKLTSVWTLWWTSVICTDKTWTLTKNEMTVSDISTRSDIWSIGIWEWIESFIWDWNVKTNKELKSLIEIWVLCNEASLEMHKWKIRMIWDPTEWCLLVLANKYWLEQGKLLKNQHYIKTLSFDSERKMMTSIYENKWEATAFSKWAPESILSKCSHIQENWKVRKINKTDILKITERVGNYENNALRILAFSYKKLDLKQKWEYKISNTEKQMVYVWIVWIIDPPRDEVKEAINITKKAWIKVIMITGDAPQTALAIAKKIWLVENWEYNLILWEETAWLSDKKLLKILFDSKVPIFARIDPVSKRRIVEILQSSWERVAVTWDWVNDAPALKKADIWVSMWIAWTDVAKESSDLILLNDSFATIEIAISEWRRIYENMKKFIYYIFSTNIWELVLIIWALFLWLKNPLSPILILSINLLTDIFPALALWVEKASDDIILKKPKDYWDKFFNKVFIYQILFSWFMIWVISMFIFIYYLNISYIYAVSATFAWITVMQIMNSYNSKSRIVSIFSKKLKHNVYLYLSSIIWLLLVFFIVQTDLGNSIFSTTKLDIYTWSFITIISFSLIVIEEGRKGVVNLKFKS